MERSIYRDEDEPRGGLSLIAIVIALFIMGAFLVKVDGLPHLPAHIPSWATIVTFLNGSDVPLDALAYIFITAAWVLWFWIMGSIVVHVILVIADKVTEGAHWVRTLHVVVDPLTFPMVRRVVNGAVVAAFVVNVAGRTTVAHAAPVTPVVVMATTNADPPASVHDEAKSEAQRTVMYTVQPGDTLWTIAIRFYKTGEEYPRLLDANDGRVMPDGSQFTRAGMIRPGWRLVVPLPSEALEEVDGKTYYVVEPGDTLWGIAGRFLDDPTRWSEIFELNRGVARHPQYGWTLTNANLIWPGLRLQVPIQLTETAPPPAPAPPPLIVNPPAVRPDERVHVSPTPVAPTPTPTATEAVRQATPLAAAPTAPSTPVVVAEPVEAPAEGTSPVVWGAIAATMAAAAGAAALAARRRVRRSLSEPPVRDDDDGVPNRGFVEADLARTLVHRLHGKEVDAASLVADAVCRFLREHDVDEVTVLSVQQGRDTAALTLSGGLQQLARILELAEDLGTHLGATATASPTPDHDILLQMTGLQLTRLLVPKRSEPDSEWLIPIGVIPKRDTLYINYRELGHILIAGAPGSGTDVVLTSLLSAIGARVHPEEMLWHTIVNPRLLPAQVAQFPHQLWGIVDATNDKEVMDSLKNLVADVEHPAYWDTPPTWRSPEPVDLLVIGELADFKGFEAALDTLATHGPAEGVRVIAATSQPEALDDETLALFNTRIVLQTLDEAQSVRLIAQPDAPDLANGEMLIRLDGRSSIWARGFRVSPEHLDQLVRLMKEVLDEPPPATPDPQPDNGAPLPRPPQPAPVSELEPVPNGHVDVVPDEPAATGQCDEGADEPVLEQLTIDEILPVAADPTPQVSTNGHAPIVEVAAETPPLLQPDEELAAGEELAPPITVQCFGEFIVRSGKKVMKPRGKGSNSFIAWETLAFLATYPEDTVPRDKLTTALWPDAEPQLAYVRLRNVLSKLRNSLRHQAPGLIGDIVLTEQNDTRRLDPKVVRSDAQEFLALCRAARKAPPSEAISAFRQALDLYQGDLLMSCTTYTWVDDRSQDGGTLREYYRVERDHATRRLAQLYYETGQARLAVPLYKRLLKEAPIVEEVVRELYRCYQQMGDLNALVREDRLLRDALREAYRNPNDPNDDPRRYQPERETITLYNTIYEELKGKGVVRRTDDRGGVKEESE